MILQNRSSYLKYSKRTYAQILSKVFGHWIKQRNFAFTVDNNDKITIQTIIRISLFDDYYNWLPSPKHKRKIRSFEWSLNSCLKVTTRKSDFIVAVTRNIAFISLLSVLTFWCPYLMWACMIKGRCIQSSIYKYSKSKPSVEDCLVLYIVNAFNNSTYLFVNVFSHISHKPIDTHSGY